MKITSVFLLFALFVSAFAQISDEDPDCLAPTRLTLQEGVTSVICLGEGADVSVFASGPGNGANALFVNARQGGLQFLQPVSFGFSEAQCDGTISYEENTLNGEDLTVFINGAYFSLIYDNAFAIGKRDNQEFSSVKSVEGVSSFSSTLQGEVNNYFFSNDKVFTCLTTECTAYSQYILPGNVVASSEHNGELYTLVNSGEQLSLYKIEELVMSFNIESPSSSWALNVNEKVIIAGISIVDGNNALVSAKCFAGVCEYNHIVVSESIEFVGKPVKTIIAVSISSEEGISSYICNGEVKKISQTKSTSNIWDMSVSSKGQVVFALASGSEITVVTCETPACIKHSSTIISAPGVVSSVNVEYTDRIIIGFSIENGDLGIAQCLDSECTAASLIQAHTLLSSNEFSFIAGDEFLIFANGFIQTFNNKYASPNAELCRAAISGNTIVESSEVFSCNTIKALDGYTTLYYWASFAPKLRF